MLVPNDPVVQDFGDQAFEILECIASIVAMAYNDVCVEDVDGGYEKE